MTNCLWGVEEDNRVLTGTLTASSFAAGLDAGQLQNPHGSTATAWTSAAGVTTVDLTIDAGSAVTWRAFGIFNTNLTTAAEVRWRLGNDSTFATYSVSTGLLTGTVAAGYRQSLYIHDADVTYRYARLRIQDPTNPEGLIRVAQAFAGPAIIPQHNWSWSTAYSRVAATGIGESRGGQEFPEYRYARRAWQVDMPNVRAAESWSVVERLQIAAQAGGNVLFVPRPDNDDRKYEAVFGRLASTGALRFPNPSPLFRGWSCTITERL